MAVRLITKLANTVVEDEGVGGGARPPGTEFEGPAAEGVGAQASGCRTTGGLAPGVAVLFETVIANFWPFMQCIPKVQI